MCVRPWLSGLLALTLGLAGCAPAVLPPEAPTSLPPASQATPTPVATPSPAPGRSATLSELANDVWARFTDNADLQSASEGDRVDTGGLVRTGTQSKVRLDLTEGTIVRLGADSEFTVTELTPDLTDPFTRISLLAGQLWVILSGGELAVETPVGVATVRGSYLGVAYDPVTQQMIVTCLEGECGLSNAIGSVALVGGQGAEILALGAAPTGPHPLTAPQVEAWVQANPEASTILPVVYPQGTPTPGPGDSRSPGGVGPVVPGQGTGEPLRYNITNFCKNQVTIRYSGPESGSLDLNPGETRSGELPPGQYTFSDGQVTVMWNSASGPLVGGPCDQAGAPPAGASPPPPGSYVNTQPLRYNLNHNCPADPQTGVVREGIWEWTFENVTTGEVFSVSVNPGETQAGELPPGRYRVSDRDATGPLESGELESDFGPVAVNRCG